MFECAPEDGAGPRQAGCLCHTPAFARLNARLSQKFAGSFVGSGHRCGLRRRLGKRARPRFRAAGQRIAFTNARLFDGKSDALMQGLRVVVDGRMIDAVEPADAPLGAEARTVDCGGRVLMPGLIDAHWHAMLASLPLDVLMTADVGYVTLVAADEARKTLMRGFTSVRDMAGPTFALKRAIDEGVVEGPRIWPSGAMISQTGGHGDFRLPYEVPSSPNAPLSRIEAIGAGSHRRRGRSRADASSRTADAGRKPAQARRRRRRVVELRSDRHQPIHRGRVPRRGGRGGKLGHLCRCARLYAPCDQDRDPRRRALHRARAADGRGDRAADR